MAARKDHSAIGYFRVEIDGIQGASFKRVSGLKVETEVYEYQEGGDNETTLKLVGPTKASNITLSKGFIADPALYAWRDEVVNSGTKKISRRNGAIVAMSPDGHTELARWNFQKAWPVRWEMSDFDASSGQAAVETLELAVERIVKQ